MILTGGRGERLRLGMLLVSKAKQKNSECVVVQYSLRASVEVSASIYSRLAREAPIAADNKVFCCRTLIGVCDIRLVTLERNRVTILAPHRSAKASTQRSARTRTRSRRRRPRSARKYGRRLRRFSFVFAVFF